MGLYYHSFLKKLKKSFDKQSLDVESFLKSKEVNEIFKEFDIEEGTLQWALNITEFYNENEIKETEYFNKASGTLDKFLENDNRELIPSIDKKSK